MHTCRRFTVLFLSLAGIFLCTTVHAGLVHRYRFDGDCNDSAGTAHGRLVNNTGNSAYDSGTLTLGNTGAQRSNAGDGDYVDLPNGIISALGNEGTFEAWVTWDRGVGGDNWQRVLDFGTSQGGEDSSAGGNNQYYVMVTPRSSPGTLRAGYRNGISNAERWVETGVLATGGVHHVALVWDGNKTTATLYLNGAVVSQDTATHIRLDDLTDNNNWLGRAQWNDPSFVGSYHEFRIHDHAMTSLELGASRLAGPDEVITNNVALAERGNLRYHPIDLVDTLGSGKMNFLVPVLRRGEQILGGIPFSIAEDEQGEHGWNSHIDGGNGGDVRSLVIPVNHYGVIEVHALMGTFWGETGVDKLAALLFTDSDGNTLHIDLDGGSELRDYQTSAYADTINANTTTEVLNSPGGRDRRVDKTRIILPDGWATRTLASITLEDRGVNGVQRSYIVGLTVATLPIVDVNADDIGSGDGASVANWANYGSLAGFEESLGSAQPIYSATVDGANAVTFDGMDDRLQTQGTPAPTNVTGDSDFTVEAWVHDRALSEKGSLVHWAKRGGPPGSAGQMIHGYHAAWGAMGHWGDQDMGFDGGLPAAGEWHHVVATYPGGGGVTEKVYVDGALNAYENKTLDLHGIQNGSPMDVVLGAATNPAGGGFNAASWFSGSLAEVRMHDRQLTAEEVIDTYNAAAASYGRAAVKARETAGQLLVDIDARDLSLAASGAVVARWVNKGTEADFTQSSAAEQPRYHTNVEGIPAVTFDGGDFMESSTAPATITTNSDWSVELWVRNAAILPEECIFNWARRGDLLKVGQINYGTSPLFGAVTHWTNAGDMGYGGGAPAAGEWHHIVVTYPGGNGPEKVYVDGVLSALENKTLNLRGPMDGDTVNMTLGSSTEFNGVKSLYFSGSVAALRVHDGELTARQIYDNYNTDAEYYGRTRLDDDLDDPLDIALAVWQFRDGNDANANAQNSAMTTNGSFSLGNTDNTDAIEADNADGFAANEGAGTSYGLRNLGGIGTEELHIGGSVTIFGRVRMAQFDGVDDIVRVGRRGDAGLDYFSVELNNSQARFSVVGEGCVGPADNANPVGYEVNVGHASPLTAGSWYDVTGTFDADARALTVYVYSPETGLPIGSPATFAVSFNALELQFDGTLSEVLFLEAPGSFNGENAGGQLELAAIWDVPLSQAQVARLSMPTPGGGTLFIVR